MRPFQSFGSIIIDEYSLLCTDNSPADHELRSPRRVTSLVMKRLHSEKFRREKELFNTEGLTSHRQLLLWHLALSLPLTSYGLELLYRLIVKVANVLLMNALEITHWSMQLTATSADCGLKTNRLLLFTGFASKMHFNADVRALEQRCVKMLPAFPQKFRRWLLMTDCEYDLPLRRLNLEYSELREGHMRKLPCKTLRPVRKETDLSTEEDWERQMEQDMLEFEEGTMQGEKLSPLYTSL
jgi:hypothetical protein